MKFKTYYDKKEVIYTEPGSGMKDEYQLRVTEDGENLVKIGESNLYEYIQSHKESVDIHKILERCALLDDYSILNRMPARFMDVSEMPTTLAGAYAAIKDAEAFFDKMPLSVKQAYDNDFTEFLSSLGTERFNKTVGDYLESIKSKEEVKDENGES